MAVTYTVTGAGAGLGPFRYAYGTFTSANGDGVSETLTATTHGMNHIIHAAIHVDTVPALRPGLSISSGTITWTVENTNGAAGRFFILGL